MWLEEAGSTLMEEVVGAEGLREEGGEGAEGGVLLGGDEDLDLPGAADLLEELTAVAAGHGGDGEADDAGLASGGGVRHQELLRMNGVVERQTGELKVHADEDSAAGPQSDGADVVAGDRRPRESLGGGDEEWEEIPHGGDARLLGHGLRLRRLNHEPPAHRYRFLLLHLRLVVVSVLLEAWKGASKPRKKKDGNYLTSRFKDSGFDSILGNRVASITQSQWIREQHSRFIGEALSYICNVEPSAGEREEGSITGDRLHALLRRALPPPPAIRLQIEPSPMATATRYWIVSLPVQNSATTLWNRLRESISKNSFDTPLYRFNTPDLRVGTLDSLLALSDDLVKSNAFIEGVTHKIRRQIEELEKASGVEVGALTVDGVPVDSYLTRFVWDEGKYPTMSPLREIVDNIHVQVAKLEDDMKVRVAEYSNIRSQLNAINRKQSGSLAVRDLSNLVNPEDIVTSEHLVTLLAIVPKYSQKDWLSSYETLTTFVVPRSAKKLHEDNEYALYTLTLFRKVVDNFRNNAREKGFQIREFEYSPESQESRKQELEKLMQDQESKRSSLLQWCYASYGEVFVSWMHFCAVRVFAESILRYGLPPSFLSVVLAPFVKSEKKVRSILEALCGNVNSSYWKSEDEVSVPGIAGEGEAYPYVSFTLNLV